jgi:hypothetical protein
MIRYERGDTNVKITWFERGKITESTSKMTLRAIAIKNLTSMINKALLNEDIEFAKTCADTIERILGSMLIEIGEIKRQLEEISVENNKQQ